MQAALTIGALWILFAVTHMALSSVKLRPRLVGALGQTPFLGMYSLVSLATFVPMVWLYFANKHAGPHLWYLGSVPGMRWGVYVGMGVAFALVVAGNTRPAPTSMAASMAKAGPEPQGVLRVTRHPLFMGLGLFGLLHLLVASVNAAELAFFAGFPLFAVIGCRHQDQRKLASGDPDFRRFHAATPFLPSPAGVPAALRQDPVPIAVGVALAALVRWFHPSLFGG